jgi:hypothetical protein
MSRPPSIDSVSQLLMSRFCLLLPFNDMTVRSHPGEALHGSPTSSFQLWNWLKDGV